MKDGLQEEQHEHGEGERDEGKQKRARVTNDSHVVNHFQ
jgi:hypothetical protein